MKQLSIYINEKLVLNKDTFKKNYKYFPETKKELFNIVSQLINEQRDQDIIDLNDIDTSKITDMSLLFRLSNIKNIDISRWDVSKVKNMNSMFLSCGYLESIGDISTWNMSKVNNISSMFEGCKNLESIGDISNWDVSNVIDMIDMFYGCKKLKDIGDLSNWDISNVNEMKNMFLNSGIKNIPSWYKQ